MADGYRFLLRMPQSLREQLQAAIADSGHSLNKEVLARLEASLDETDRQRRRRRRDRAHLVGLVAALVAVVLAAAFIAVRYLV